MKKIIVALTLAATATAVWATCTTHSYSINGRYVTCTTCCYGSNCSTNCY